MLEEGELLEHGVLTGLRLCNKDCWKFPNGSSNEWNRTFSAFTDPNEVNRLFICSQNGQLRVLDGSKKSSNDYHLLFRRFSNTNNGDPDAASPVTWHWDKLTLLPGRPGEMLFVLGISKAIMYTAVPGFTGPYPKGPLLAKTTRGDVPDFAYGTPVIELTSHDSRVTAMAVSPSSSLLVSGDEHGFIKLLLLSDESTEAALAGDSDLHEWKKQQTSSFSGSHRKIENMRLTIRGHEGPVFSLQWLPVSAVVKRSLGATIRGLGALAGNEGELVHSNCFASGSSDRKVRLWRTSLGNRSGLSLTPIIVVDTLATHILTMHCYLCLKDEAVIPAAAAHEELVAGLEQVGLTTADIMMGHDHGLSVFTHARMEELMSDETNNAFIDPHQPGVAMIYLAGGTNLGCVYLWKFSYGELYRLIAAPAPVFSIENLPLDEGMHLYSLLQSSSAAIVHVTVSSVLVPSILDNYGTRCIMLTTSDTQRIVRSHCDCGVVTLPDYKNLASSPGASFVLCGESIFDSTVVSCHFYENPQPEDVLSRLKRPQEGGQGTGKQRHELDHMVSTALVEDFLEYFESKRRERRKRQALKAQVLAYLNNTEVSSAYDPQQQQAINHQKSILKWLEGVEKEDNELRCSHLLVCTSSGDISIFMSEELTGQKKPKLLAIAPDTTSAAAATTVTAATADQSIRNKNTTGTSTASANAVVQEDDLFGDVPAPLSAPMPAPLPPPPSARTTSFQSPLADDTQDSSHPQSGTGASTSRSVSASSSSSSHRPPSSKQYTETSRRQPNSSNRDVALASTGGSVADGHRPGHGPGHRPGHRPEVQWTADQIEEQESRPAPSPYIPNPHPYPTLTTKSPLSSTPNPTPTGNPTPTHNLNPNDSDNDARTPRDKPPTQLSDPRTKLSPPTAKSAVIPLSVLATPHISTDANDPLNVLRTLVPDDIEVSTIRTIETSSSDHRFAAKMTAQYALRHRARLGALPTTDIASSEFDSTIGYKQRFSATGTAANPEAQQRRTTAYNCTQAALGGLVKSDPQVNLVLSVTESNEALKCRRDPVSLNTQFYAQLGPATGLSGLSATIKSWQANNAARRLEASHRVIYGTL